MVTSAKHDEIECEQERQEDCRERVHPPARLEAWDMLMESARTSDLHDSRPAARNQADNNEPEDHEEDHPDHVALFLHRTTPL